VGSNTPSVTSGIPQQAAGYSTHLRIKPSWSLAARTESADSRYCSFFSRGHARQSWTLG